MRPRPIHGLSDAVGEAGMQQGGGTSTPVRLGIVGLGAMGAEMLDVAASHPGFEVLRACDVSDATLDRLHRGHPTVSFTTSARDVVGSPDLDAVYVATPPVFHAELAIAAMRSGKAVFCEKPLAISLADGRRMCEVAGQSGVASAVNFALSDRHATLEVERSLQEGQVGKVLGVDVRLCFPRWPREFQSAATWLAEREQGGFIREVFSHFAYLTDRLLGPLRPVNVSVDYPLDDQRASEVAARGFLRSGGVPVQVSAVSGAAAPELYEWTLWGERRSYLLRNWGELFVADSQGWIPVDLQAERGSEATRLSLFANAIQGERQPSLADFAAAFRVQQVVEAFHRTEPAAD
jgi:predicted dehydrogenase